MKRNINPASVKIINFEQVFANRKIRQHIPFIIDSSGNGYYLYNGRKLSEKELNELLPIEFKRRGSENNPDKSKCY